ncbi:MAG: acetate--CoA ligase family protein, partial [Flavobacteriaceae bacterium]
SIRELIDSVSNGYLSPDKAIELLDLAGIPRVEEVVVSDRNTLEHTVSKMSFPLVMKVVGPLHKSDANGVILNVTTLQDVYSNFDKLMDIDGATGVLLQPMLSGLELFIGVKKEPGFNHTILCGLGGIYIEVMQDVSAGLSPLSKKEISQMVKSLKGYKLIKGTRGQQGIHEELFIDIIQRLSALVELVPEIIEMDINPLIATNEHITAVDVRIRIEK